MLGHHKCIKHMLLPENLFFTNINIGYGCRIYYYFATDLPLHDWALPPHMDGHIPPWTHPLHPSMGTSPSWTHPLHPPMGTSPPSPHGYIPLHIPGIAFTACLYTTEAVLYAKKSSDMLPVFCKRMTNTSLS